MFLNHYFVLLFVLLMVRNGCFKKVQVENGSDSNLYLSDEFSNIQLLKLVDDIGQSSPKKIYQKIYNNKQITEVCWKELIFVKESKLDKYAYSWKDYEIHFNHPGGCCASYDMDSNKKSLKPRFKDYSIKFPKTGKIQQLKFRIIKDTENFTIGQYSDEYCGSGNYITKTYYEWPNTTNTKIVIKLSDKTESNNDDELSTTDDIVPYLQNSNELDDESTTNDSIEAILRTNVVGSIHQEETTTEYNNKIRKNNQSNLADLDEIVIKPLNKNELNEDDPDLQQVFDMVLNDPAKEKKRKGKNYVSPHSLSSNQPNSGAMTNESSLFSGQGLLPALFNIGRKDSIVLKGDILVSRKYFNKKNNSEVEEPLYVIHEGIEIEKITEKK